MNLPAPLTALLRALPETPPAWAIATGLNAALAAGWLSRDALEPVRGRSVRLELADLGVGATVSLGAFGFRAACDARADVTIRARAADYAALALRRDDPDTLFFHRRLVIEGDTELGLVVKNALDAIDWPQLPWTPAAQERGRVVVSASRSHRAA